MEYIQKLIALCNGSHGLFIPYPVCDRDRGFDQSDHSTK